MNKVFGLDRKPWGWVQLYNGRNQTIENPGAIQPWWNDPDRAYDGLYKRVKSLFDVGARKIMLNRPHGSSGNTHVSGASWFTMKSFQQEAIKRIVQEFPDVRFTPFIGSALHKQDDLVGYRDNQDNSHITWMFSIYNGVKADAWRNTILEWHKAGIRDFVLDAAAMTDRRDHFVKVHKILEAGGINIVGEAIPRIDRHKPISKYTEAMPYMCTNQFFEDSHMEREGVRFNPSNTRIMLWYNSHISDEPEDFKYHKDKMDQYIKRGLIPVLSDPEMFEYVNSLKHLE